VRNESPRGATFRIEIPRLSVPGAPQLEENPKSVSARGARILVVDTNESILETVSALLTANEHSVSTSRSLVEARKLFVSNRFDLVIADWQLVSGAQQQAGGGQSSSIGLGPRILWTSAALPEKSSQNWVLAADSAVLQKPFHSADLLAAVDAELQRLPALLQ